MTPNERRVPRRPMPGAVAGLIGLIIGACSSAPKMPPPSTDIEEGGFRSAVRTLASDDFEGRRPGTQGETKTVAYLSDIFRKLGLQPGNHDSFLQPVPLVELQAAGDAALSIAGRGAARTLRYGEDMVIWSARPAEATQLAHSELVFVGYGIAAPEYDWNDYAGVDVRGKTVLVLDGDPGSVTGNPALFRGKAMSRYGRWAYKFEEAARRGAAGVLLVHDARTEGYDWSVVVNRWTGPQLQLARADDSAGGAAIEGWISVEAGRKLLAAAGQDPGAAGGAAAHPGFKGLALGLTVDASVHSAIRRFSSNNLIAVMPGSERRHEYVLYTAHWDQLGRTAQGAVQSGAVEDATGVAGMLVIAQSLRRTRPPPGRSIVFLVFTGGEAGLLGSRYYVENPVFPLHDTAAVLNLDGLRPGGRTRDVMLIGAGNSEAEEYVRSAALLQGRELSAEIHPEQGLYYRSDDLNFALHGVPALYLRAGIDDSARGPVWGRAQIDDYMANRYLKPADKYSEEWDVRGALEDLAVYYTVGERLAETRRFPRWFPGSEFNGLATAPRESE